MASEAARAVVMVGERGTGEGSARRAVQARKARATGARPLLQVTVDDETGETLAIPAPVRGEPDIDFDAPLFETARDAAQGAWEASDWIEARLVSLHLHPRQPLPRLDSPGAVARAVRDTAGMRKGRMPKTPPSAYSIHDARDAACADVGCWLAQFVTEGEAEAAALAALTEGDNPILSPGKEVENPLRLWTWILAYRAARRTLRAWRWGTKRDTTRGERAPVVLGGEEGEAKLATLRAEADAWSEARDKRARAHAMRAVARAVAHLGDNATTATARARTRDGVRVVLRVVARVVVAEESLAKACEREGTTVDAIAQRAERLGFWRALDDWQRHERMAESRPLAWLGGAAIRLRAARARVPSKLPEVPTGPFALPRPDAPPKGTLARGKGVLVRLMVPTPVPGSIPHPDTRQGTSARLRRRALGMRALASLIQARDEVTTYSRLAARDLAARRADWLAVSAGWRTPGKVSGKRRAKRA